MLPRQDIKDIAPDVLRHRLILTYEADAEGVDADAIVLDVRGLNAQHGNLGDLPVSAVMVHDPLVCAPEDTSESVRDRMTQQHVRYVPVVEGGRLLGVISFHDIAKAAIKEASFENRLLKRYIKNWPEQEAPR